MKTMTKEELRAFLTELSVLFTKYDVKQIGAANAYSVDTDFVVIDGSGCRHVVNFDSSYLSSFCIKEFLA